LIINEGKKSLGASCIFGVNFDGGDVRKLSIQVDGDVGIKRGGKKIVEEQSWARKFAGQVQRIVGRRKGKSRFVGINVLSSKESRRIGCDREEIGGLEKS